MNTSVISSGKCGCGCSGQCSCESQCCDLECLERPNFYCGQLLTDADLSTLVEWTRKRFALSRYRDGWGVVCGLDLSCSGTGEPTSCCGSSKGGKGPWIYLSPGYAVDCCGNDLVVCEPIKIDLSSVCRSPDDPCLPRPPEAEPDPDDGQDGEQPARDCFSIDRENLIAVQVYLRYGEQLTQGQRAMFRGSGGGCGGTDACEYARVLESPCIHLEVVPLEMPDGDDDGQPESEFETWMRAFVDRFRRQMRALIAMAANPNVDAYLKYIRDNPPYQLCYLKGLVCCLRDSDAFTSSAAMRVSIFLLYDWILREIQCNCFSCSPDKGVPLGRVLLLRKTEGRTTTCSVYMVDPSSRHRRWIRQEACQAAEFRELDLSDLFGQSVDSVTKNLDAAGVAHEVRDWSDVQAANVNELATALERPTLRIDPSRQRSLRAHVIRDPLGIARVFAFEARNEP